MRTRRSERASRKQPAALQSAGDVSGVAGLDDDDSSREGDSKLSAQPPPAKKRLEMTTGSPTRADETHRRKTAPKSTKSSSGARNEASRSRARGRLGESSSVKDKSDEDKNPVQSSSNTKKTRASKLPQSSTDEADNIDSFQSLRTWLRSVTCSVLCLLSRCACGTRSC